MLKKQLNQFLFLLFFFVAISLISSKQAKAIGVGAEINLDLIDNIFVPKNVPVLKDHVFIGATAFANYFDSNQIRYDYGFGGKLGYKIADASVYGLAGVHDLGFKNNQGQYFKNNSLSPIYGIGIGYDFPLINLGIRLENNFFSLDKKDNSKENFNFVGFRVVLAL